MTEEYYIFPYIFPNRYRSPNIWGEEDYIGDNITDVIIDPEFLRELEEMQENITKMDNSWIKEGF